MSRLFGGAKAGGSFWSGGPLAETAAKNFGRLRLGDTAVGRLLKAIPDTRLGNAIANPLWASASTEWAKRAPMVVDAFINTAGQARYPVGMFWTQEMPVLVQRGVQILWHFGG